MTDLSVVEICAGAGGQSLGLHLAGFRHRLAVELDTDAADTLRRNLTRLAKKAGEPAPEIAIGDVADEAVWRPEDYKGVSLLAGGVPCPPFSIAGQQKGATDERDLFAWSVEAAGRMTPDAVLLENVRGLSMPRFAGYRQAVLDRFAELGYRADWRLLEAKDYGVPQLRPRFILVALREEFASYFAWPEPTPAVQTVGAALYDLMAANGWPGAEAWSERANRIAPTIVGGSKKHGGPDLGPTRAKREWRQIGVDGLGIADSAPGPEHPVSHVPKLTNAMVARLQGWSGPAFKWDFGERKGKKTTTYRQIGNAFPPPVARAIGASIAAALRKEGEANGTHGTAETFHDEVYRVLKEKGSFMSVTGISRALGGSISRDEIERRIEFIKRDFEVEERSRAGAPTYKLGSWRAFRGQDDHERNLVFAERKLRSRVS
ncbi:DNA cytosine methyltransferase [Mycolicibacterium goodii]|uniref:DNA cytosine methyltransferase n=1 Tax=Mycolicibacterium goodii TaxID=134601 RepID=UPI001BDCCBB1|nr:DNA (cytosine-5-)-methyltransferase [Mycolicibacterium goodii]MBU8808839.1 DNA cytosine methyltransferase [Mycolicibacterium goodii]ULN48878.1 DNA cytosine methyltransferase [Mycolicibacterium goodii]